MLERRSSGFGGGIADQSDSTATLWARPGPRLYLALLAAVAVVACFLPLADHLGYEFSELIALAAGIFGAAPGIAAARMEADRRRALAKAVWFGLWALAVPLGIILLNGVRRPGCDPASGAILFVALAVLRRCCRPLWASRSAA